MSGRRGDGPHGHHGDGHPPRIEELALLGDLHTGALVDRAGDVVWLCLPRFDSPACFASLLGGPDAGTWRVAPAAADARLVSRRYRPDSLVLESEWDADGGRVRVVDLMPPREDAPVLVRVVEGLSGTVRMATRLRPRLDYGRVPPWFRHEDGRWSAVAGPDALWLDGDVPLDLDDQTLSGTWDVRAGRQHAVSLTWATSWSPPPPPTNVVDAVASVGATDAFWTGWISRCRYSGRYADQVRRSLVTLKALTYAPTGGIVAAATTSLPERVGGARNWDYRYCWLRDTAFTLQALVAAGYVGEARAWRDWLLRAAAGDPADLQIMYTLSGRRRLPEQTLDWLPGYEGSTPVRMGNAASDQFQLDVYGELLDGLHTARDAGLSPDDHAWDLQSAITEHLETVWHEPDNSLWEVRGPRRHFVHSKVMAWAGLDRMVRTARRSRLPGPVDRWAAARDAVHDEVCREGYDADRSTFTQYYGSRSLDAALLLIPRVGFLPPTDPRVRGTVDAVRRELLQDGFVLRYRTGQDAAAGAGDAVDGLTGGEGAFLACSFWLTDALALTGHEDDARELFERLLGCASDLGLLSEEWDPSAHRQLGNTPQAFSHVGLVNTAMALERSTAHLHT